MDDERLIVLVQNNDVIYNKFNKDNKIPKKSSRLVKKFEGNGNNK